MLRPLGLAVRTVDLITSPCLAPTFLKLRRWCAWTGSSIAPSGGRYRLGGPRSSGIAGRSSARSSLAACGGHRYRSTSPDRFVDPDSGDDTGDPCVFARGLTSHESMDVRPHGHPRCRTGAPGARSVVGRCPPLWMEAHPHFRSIDVAASLNPFLACCFARKGDLCLPQFRAAVPNWCPPSHEVGLSAARSLFRMASMKLHSIVKWYRILRVHYQLPVFQAIRCALWLAR